MSATALRALKRFAREESRAAACELCALPLGDQHTHLLEPERANLVCACQACSLLFASSGDGRLLRVERSALRLALELDDVSWARLGVPVGVAFFTTARGDGSVRASFPGRAGLVESTVEAEVWRSLCAEHVALARLAPEVEALLVRRTARVRDYFRVSIDLCYELTGELRRLRAPLGMPNPELLDRFFESLSTAPAGAHGRFEARS
jgi:hypothetical protein